MADVQRSKKRRQSTNEVDDINYTPWKSSLTKHPRSTKKEKHKAKTPSPEKGRKDKASKVKRSDLPGNSNIRSPSEAKNLKPARFKTPDPIEQAASSPLTTPKTPRPASKFGIPADVAKTLLKYASRLNPLVGMIYAMTQYFAEKNEDMPSREEFLQILVDCVNSLVHSLHASPLIARIRYSSTKNRFQH